jgi:UDP-3-O-[3-hydroxymyristoyl] glucosamine N-acyltransferase
MQARLADIASLLGGELVGDASITISRIATLEAADGHAIGFLANPRYQSQLATTQAACVIVAPALREAAAARGAALVCEDPYLAFARLTQWWAAQSRRKPAPGVHASAVVEEGAFIDASAAIGAFARTAMLAKVLKSAPAANSGRAWCWVTRADWVRAASCTAVWSSVPTVSVLHRSGWTVATVGKRSSSWARW